MMALGVKSLRGGKFCFHHKENNLEGFLSHVANSVEWYNHLKITNILVQVLGCTNHIYCIFPGGMRKELYWGTTHLFDIAFLEH